MEALNEEYEIRKYDSHFKEQILDLQQYHWGPARERNAAYFEWKYERNPYISIPIILVALKNASVIGMLGMFGTKWEFGEGQRSMICPGAADLVVHPAHRRRGLLHVRIRYNSSLHA